MLHIILLLTLENLLINLVFAIVLLWCRGLIKLIIDKHLTILNKIR